MKAVLRSQIALTMVRGLGPVQAKSLLTHFDIEELFLIDKATLLQAQVLTASAAESLIHFADWERVEKEIRFIEKNNIDPLFITDNGYPTRLLTCHDAPVLLYYKGSSSLNSNRIIAVVGTRDCTRQGMQATEELIAQLAPYDVTIVSGLALGIDSVAHQTALQNGLPTIAVLPLGLDAIYPALNRSLARQLLKAEGGLLTESMTDHKSDSFLFPRRNRIVAGMSDATIVIESGNKGGSLITARLAADYGRDVFALPGRVSDTKSKGCHQLIKQQVALLAESGEDIARWLGWEKIAPDKEDVKKRPKNKELVKVLSPFERDVLALLERETAISTDQLKISLKEEIKHLATALINLELAGLIVSLPGNRYQSL